MTMMKLKVMILMTLITFGLLFSEISVMPTEISENILET